MFKKMFLTPGVKQTRHMSLFYHSNIELHQANNPAIQVKMLFKTASDLERQRKFSEAEDIYKNIIYEINPKEEEAYDKLVQLWSKNSIFGFTTKRVEDLLEQYRKNFPADEMPSSPRLE